MTDFSIAYDIETLEQVYLFDTTTPVVTVGAVRVLFGTYDSITSTESVSELKAWREYKLSQNTTINGKAYLSGATVLFANDYKLTGTNKAVETGYYGERITWIPSAVSPAAFSPSQTGYTTIETYFADLAFSVRYETYGAEINPGTITPGGTKTYYVKGLEGKYITIGSETYYAGETFTKSSPFTFANGTGSNTICEFIGSVEHSFATKKNAYNVLQTYIESIADPAAVTNSQRLQYDFLTVNALFQTINMMEDQDYDVSLEEVQTVLNNINEFWSNLSNVR
jgi:hypothetical protein